MEQRTLEKLKNFASINKSLLFREGNVIRTQNPEKTVFARTVVGDVFNREFGIFDLTQLLSTWSLLDNPSISFEEDFVKLSSNDGTEIVYYYADPRHIQAPKNADIKLPDVKFSFVLEKDVFEKLIKASAVMKLTNLYISTGGVVAKNPDGTGNEFKCPITEFNISAGEEVEEDEQFNINIDSLKFIPDTYDVYVTDVVLKFKSQNDDLEYYVVLND